MVPLDFPNTCPDNELDLPGIVALLQHNQLAVANQALTGFLAQNEPKSRDRACETLLSPTLEALANGDFEARWLVGKILVQLGPGAIPTLLALWEDPTVEMEQRWFIGKVLAAFPEPVVIASLAQTLLLPGAEELHTIAAQSLGQMGPTAIKPLASLLQYPENRALATKALAQIPAAAVIDPLLTVVQDADSQVRTLAITALGSFPEERVLPALFQACTDPVSTVRKEAVIALGNWADRLNSVDLLAYLQPRLYDLDLGVCQQAALALSRLSGPAVAAALWSAWQAPATPMALRLTLLQSLVWLESPLALTYLHQAWPKAQEIERLEIVRLLGRIKQVELQRTAAQMLTAWVPMDLHEDSGQALAKAIAYSWGQLKYTPAVPILQTWANRPEPALHLQARAALKHLQA
ncbi:HEAT repeat domain-containing protein [Synechocystis sp. LKSZ1]|uniref:HEAT repeat domain-containing protein n=1 Tax=Synechocystis sp. LKSZ1 TaxID=3144951 RepID=UPI00336BE3DE